MFAAEHGLGPVPGEVLNLVGKLLTAVVATPGIPLRIFVCEDTAQGGQDLRERIVF